MRDEKTRGCYGQQSSGSSAIEYTRPTALQAQLKPLQLESAVKTYSTYSLHTSPLLRSRSMESSLYTMYPAAMAISMPWPTSPNMTANRNGKLIMVHRPGLTSWYVATPYASTIACGDQNQGVIGVLSIMPQGAVRDKGSRVGWEEKHARYRPTKRIHRRLDSHKSATSVNIFSPGA